MGVKYSQLPQQEPEDSDILSASRSTASIGTTWAKVYTYLKAKFDLIYSAGSHTHAGTYDPAGTASSSMSTHQSTYDHTKLHDPVTAGSGISVVGQQVSNSDKGSTAVSSHEGSYAHSSIHASGSDAETATSLGTLVNGATEKTTPVNADMVPLMDSEASNVTKKLSWSNIKATLKTYFDGLYSGTAHNHDSSYLGVAAKAADSDKLDGNDSTAFATSGHTHDYSGTYLGISAKAADSDKLDGNDSSAFAAAGHNHDGTYAAAGHNHDLAYLGISAKAADSDKLDGNDSSAFATSGHTHAGMLDETAHDLLDHTGLTGVPSISGLLNETSHDLLDHTGLTGVPSISGLLNETSHDLLDHAGLTGIHASGSDAETASTIAAINHGTTEKTTLVDADEITGQNSANSFSLIRTTWTNVKSFLKTYFDTIYATIAVVLGKKIYHGIEAYGALSFDNSSHVLTIASGTNTYWFQGTKYTTANAITCDLDSYITLTTNTLYYVYFDDATGTLKAGTSFWDLRSKVPVATVYWNGSAGAVQNEAHNHTRDIDWHINAHLTIGARYYTGGEMTYPDAANDASLQIETATLYDEDIPIVTGQCTTMRGWRQASSGVYTWADYSLPYLGASGDPYWLDTDDYTLKSVGDSDYVCYWYYGTSDISRPIYVIPTQAATAHNTITAARNETPPALIGLNLNPEWKLLWKAIYKGDGQYQEKVDYRQSSSLPAGGTSAVSAAGVSFVPTGNIAAANVQAALEELDTEKQAALTFGIAQNNAVKVSAADVATGEYAKFTATGLESKTPAEVLIDINAQPAGSYPTQSFVIAMAVAL